MSEFLVYDDPVDHGDDAIRPPLGALWSAAAANLASATILVLAVGTSYVSGAGWHVAGWALSGLCALVLVFLQRQNIDRVRTTSDQIVLVPDWLAAANTGLVIVGVLLAGAHSWYFATVLAS